MIANVEIGDVENDVEQGEGGTGIIYDLICEPKVFRTRKFDFFLIWFLFPVEKENEPVDGSIVNNVKEEGREETLLIRRIRGRENIFHGFELVRLQCPRAIG